MQGFAAFRLNVQLSHEYDEKLAKAAGKFKNQLVGTAYETWKQYTQHNKMLQSRLAIAVGALRNRDLRSAFCGWREAASVRKEHKQKVRSKSAGQSMSPCKGAEHNNTQHRHEFTVSITIFTCALNSRQEA